MCTRHGLHAWAWRRVVRALVAALRGASLAMASSVIRSSGIVGIWTLVSRLLGFSRDVLFAVIFGAGTHMDAFLVAFKIPNFMRRLFAEGAFAQSFVPVLSATRESDSDEQVQELLDVVAGTLGLILIGITIIGIVLAPLLVYMFAPGFAQTPDQFELTVDMLRITFPYLLFISLTAFAGGILNTWRRFAVPAFTPVLLNICLIVAATVLAGFFEQPVMALALGVFVAGVVQLLFQLPFLWRLRLLPRPRWGWGHAQVRRILRLMLPILFGSSVAQISLLLDTLIASLLAHGSVSWLYYADRLMEFPLGVFSIAIATVILPHLSARHAANSAAEFSAMLDWALRMLLVIGLPAMLGLLLLAGPLVVTIFNYHSFGTHDTRMTELALMAYAFGFMGFSLVKVLVTGFFSREDSRTPVRCAVIALAVAMAGNIVFVAAFVWLDWAAPHVGLALGTSLGAFVNAGLLYHYLRRQQVYHPGAQWRHVLWPVAVANMVMSAILLVGVGDLSLWLERDVFARALWLLFWVVLGAGCYFAVLGVLGVRPRHFSLPDHEVVI